MTKSFPSLIIVRRAALILGLALIAALGLFASEVWAQKPPVAEKPLNLTAQVVAGGIQLNWEAPAARAAEVDGYRVYRRRPDAGEALLLVLVANTGSTATSYLDATATEPDVSYIYRVRAWRGTELSRMANKLQLTYTAPEPAPEPIPVPTLETTPTLEPIATLDPEPAGVTAELGDITDLEAAQFDTGELDGGADTVDTYRFTLSEPKKLGLGLRQQETNADLLVVDAEGVELRAARKAGAANEWITVTLSAGDYEARIEAQEAGVSNYKFRYGVAAPSIEALWRMAAEQQALQEQAQEQALAAITRAPANLRAESTAGGVQLNWDAPAVDSESVTSYRITRTPAELDGDQDLSAEFDTGATDRSYLDSAAATEGTTYTYQVKALRSGVSSEASNAVSVTYAEPQPTDTTRDTTRDTTPDENTITYIPPVEPDEPALPLEQNHVTPGRHIRTITVPFGPALSSLPFEPNFVRKHIGGNSIFVGGRVLALDDTALPEERIGVYLGNPYYRWETFITAGDRWTPSGLWSDGNVLWVVDPIHFGAHPLKLDKLQNEGWSNCLELSTTLMILFRSPTANRTYASTTTAI